MKHARFDHLLAGTALAAALALTASGGALAQSTKELAKTQTAAAPAPAASDATPSKDTNAKAAAANTEPFGPVTGPSAAKTAAADSAIADKIKEQIASGKFDRFFGGKKERTPVEAFYASRDFAPLWIADGAMSDRAKMAAAYLAGVEADGLDPADYPLPQIKAGSDPDALAEAEMRFTDAVLTYARHAQAGRVHYTRISADIVYDLVKPEPADVLAKLAKASDVAEALDSYNPPQPQYKALKAKLAEARKGSDVEKPMIPSGPVLKYGKDKKGKEELMADPRVPALRARFGMTAADGDTNYDKELSGTIAKFQKERGLSPTGQLTQATVDALNGPKREKTVDIIVANMERWRWIPRDLGKTYVMVNLPDYTLRVMNDGQQVWKTKIVIGKPNLPSPLLSAEMKYITVNPTWNVPPSIIQNEYLPALQQDPQAMERIGLKVEQNPDGTVRIYQPPGDRNALGRIRFNFPNRFLVYQHDTPDKHLFDKAERAYSHGCMRVQNPDMYAEKLLGVSQPEEGYTQARIKAMYGTTERNINFKHPIPVYITYQTVFTDDAGHKQVRADVYGLDRDTRNILHGERGKADVPVARNYNSSTKPVASTGSTRRYSAFSSNDDSWGGSSPSWQRNSGFGFFGGRGTW